MRRKVKVYKLSAEVKDTEDWLLLFLGALFLFLGLIASNLAYLFYGIFCHSLLFKIVEKEEVE